MSGLLSNSLFLSTAAAAGGYQIERSLRFNSSDSAYLSKVFPTITTNQLVTFSAWVKRAALGTRQCLLDTNRSYQTNIDFLSTNSLAIYTGNGAGVGSFDWTTTQVFRDCGAWYHILAAWDTTQGTATDRLKVYVNGQQITTWSSQVAITQNMQLGFSGTTALIGNSIQTSYLSAYLTNIHFIDGQQLTPSSFTETDATTGQLIPKAYTGSYGTNGFNLLFADNSSNTASTLGKDTSGLGNNFTPNNLSVTAGAGNDSLVDSPTNYGTDTSVGGEVRGNYCTLNPLKTTFSGDGGLPSHSNGNLDVTGSGGTSNTVGTIGVSSGKFYYETTLTATHDLNACIFGLGQSATAYSNNFGLRPSGSFGGTITSGSAFAFAIGDTVGIAYEPGVSATFYKNNNTSSFVASLSSGIWFPWAQLGGTTVSAVYNFGQRLFVNQSVPSGFKALCTQNLPAPLVAKSNTVFDVLTWSGDSATRTLTGLGFTNNVGLAWVKNRSSAINHVLQDAVRGFTTGKKLSSNLTDSEGLVGNLDDSYGYISGASATGFTIDKSGAGQDWVQMNQSGSTYVGWAWDAGTSTVSNTQGSITSQVRANATAGFSIVSYTGTGTSPVSVGHGLGVAPTFLIFKDRDSAVNWQVWTTAISSSGTIIEGLNTTAAGSTPWTYISTTSSLIQFNAGNSSQTSNGKKFICYAFTPVVGYSSFGSYTGNGSADGPFVYTGFRPRWILLKQSSSSGENWRVLDTARSTYNPADNRLLPNSSAAEAIGVPNELDTLSNGFKFRATDGASNGSGATYIYAAFAEAPLNYSRAR